MAQAIAPRRPQPRPVAPIRRTIDLASLHGEVHRFSAVVDRFGSFVSRGVTVRTVCLRELQLDEGGNPIRPDHWWFRLREVWTEAGVRVGDTVLFTAKVQRWTRTWSTPAVSWTWPGPIWPAPRCIGIMFSSRRIGGAAPMSERPAMLQLPTFRSTPERGWSSTRAERFRIWRRRC